MNPWAAAAKNLLEGHVCSNCRNVMPDNKCSKQPRPKVTPLVEDDYWECPTIETCPNWEKMWA